MKKYLAVILTAVAALFAVQTASASTRHHAVAQQHVIAQQLPQGDDTFCVGDGDVSITLSNTNRRGLAHFIWEHEGFRLLHRGACEPPPDTTPYVVCLNGANIDVIGKANLDAFIEENGGTLGPCAIVTAGPRGDNVFVCYSHFEDDPVAMTIEEFEFLTTAPQPELGGKPYWTTGFLPSANHHANATPIGNDYFPHCKISQTAPVLGHINDEGDPVSAVDWPKVQVDWKMAQPYHFLNVVA